MAQHHQLDVLVELAPAATPGQQPQDRSKREMGERKRHPATLSEPRARASASTDPDFETLQAIAAILIGLHLAVTALAAALFPRRGKAGELAAAEPRG